MHRILVAGLLCGSLWVVPGRAVRWPVQTLTAASLGGAAQVKDASKNSAATEPPNPFGEAVALYRSGRFPEAIEKPQRILRRTPNLQTPYAGLTRVYLKQKNVILAAETLAKGQALNDSPRLRVALGEVYFRQGKIHDAEQTWAQVINSGHLEPRAFLGLARVRGAVALFRLPRRSEKEKEQQYFRPEEKTKNRSFSGRNLPSPTPALTKSLFFHYP